MSGMARDDLDHRLAGFFDAAAAVALPDGLLEDTYRVTRRIPQQRGTLARRLARWRLWWSAPFGPAPRLRLVLVVAILLLALAASLVYVGSHYRRLPPPFGPARNGLLVYDVDQHLYVVDEGDGTSRLLDIGLGRSWGPVFSPDGMRFAFTAQAADRTPTELWVANADGTDAHKVSGDFPLVGGWGYSWAPDSRRIVYASDVGYFRSVLYVANADGSGVAPITPRDGADRTWPAWSPRGDLIAYRLVPETRKDLELAVISPDGGGEHPLVHAPLTTGAFAGSGWGPDGRRIAYFRKRDDYAGDLVEIVDLDSNVTPVSDPSENSFNPAWSNSGRWIAYARDPGSAVIADLVTGVKTELPLNLADCGALWTPDDKFIVGLGFACQEILRFPVDDPGLVQRIGSGAVGGVSIQRLPPGQ
jgi:Tol biopolymer transport system component